MCWEDAKTLEIIYAAHLPIQVKGTFIKSTGFQNLDAESPIAKQIQAHSIYVLNCTDNILYFYK